MDIVEVIVEKKKYADEGVHKGMQGWICHNRCSDGYWLVNFPQYGEKDDIELGVWFNGVLYKEEFYTNELYWNQKDEHVYSDSAIIIIQKDRKIYGVGFESNQTFSRYSIRQPKGTIPIEE